MISKRLFQVSDDLRFLSELNCSSSQIFIKKYNGKGTLNFLLFVFCSFRKLLFLLNYESILFSMEINNGILYWVNHIICVTKEKGKISLKIASLLT